MRRRVRLRIEARTQANAERCGIALTEWQAMTRAQRKAAKRAAKAPKAAPQVGLAGCCRHGVGMLDACDECEAYVHAERDIGFGMDEGLI